ncbi:MarR family transcriptional regulator [bacterium]|nr:MarR family transcriptional regulator [candidate division CSSED10-310 bacterium]
MPAGNGTCAADTEYALRSEETQLRILESLRRIIRAVDLHSKRLAAACNITGPQLICLMVISRHGRITTTGLARAVHLSASTVVGIVDRLAAKGLVVRARDTIDRRVVFVGATNAGEELLRQAPSPIQETFRTALHRLPSDAQETMAVVLERVVRLMEAQAIPAAPILEPGALDADVPGGAS